MLHDHEPKHYWAVADIFAHSVLPVTAFIHRDYGIGMHAHEFPEINFVVRGHGRHYFEECVFPTTQGDVFVIPPQVKHGYLCEKNLDVYHLLLAPRFLTQYGGQLRLLPGYMLFFTVEPFFRSKTDFRYQLRLDTPQRKHIMALLESLHQEIVARLPGVETITGALTLHLLVLLCRWYAEQQALSTATPPVHPLRTAIKAVMELVSTRYGKKITLGDMADAAHMQRNYFCRTFHDATGMTPMEYVRQYRMEIARKLLQETESSITEIAHEVGYYDTAHFCRTFSRYAGLPPSSLRR
jgi:AraC-like DNA-binding protein